MLGTAALYVPHNDYNQHHHNHDDQGNDAQQGPPLLLCLLCPHQLLDTLLNLQGNDAGPTNSVTQHRSVVQTTWV